MPQQRHGLLRVTGRANAVVGDVRVALAFVERLTGRPLGTSGREIVGLVAPPDQVLTGEGDAG